MNTKVIERNLTGCKESGVILTFEHAKARRDALIKKNKLVRLEQLLTTTPTNSGKSWYPVKIVNFLKMLSDFRDSRAGYNGIRVYLACYPPSTPVEFVPPGRDKQLVLLFVPTIAVPQKEAGQDVPTDTWVVDGEHIHPLNKEQAERWISCYRTTILPELTIEGMAATNDNDFKETHSHWYPMKVFKGDGDKEPGLIEFAECQMEATTNPVIGLNVMLAAFTEKESANFPKHQLTIIFHLTQREIGIGILPPEKIVPGDGFVLLSFPADTGFPCPPAACDGSFI